MKTSKVNQSALQPTRDKAAVFYKFKLVYM